MSIKTLVITALRCSGMVAVQRARTNRAFRIVTYHGVDERTDALINYDRLQTHPAVFARQVERLAREYQIVDLGEAVRRHRDTGEWPKKAMAITFDDGYRNNLDVAAPILRRMGLPATFFVTSRFVDGVIEPWWYRLRQQLATSGGADVVGKIVETERQWRALPDDERTAKLRALTGGAETKPLLYPLMSRDEVVRLMAMGFDVQPHSATHPSFGAEAAERLRTEISESAAFIRGLGGRAPWGFAYPYGHLPKARTEIEALLANEGLQAAFSMREGANPPAADPWALRRWDLHGGYTPDAVSLRVSGLFARTSGGEPA